MTQTSLFLGVQTEAAKLRARAAAIHRRADTMIDFGVYGDLRLEALNLTRRADALENDR